VERFGADMARRESHPAEPDAAPDRGGVNASSPSSTPQPPRQVS
jgi:hypothetical protein